MSEVAQYIVTVVAMALTGFVLATILFIASKKFGVKKDERIEDVENILPGINCGACGYPGCSGYAEAIVKNGDPVDKCAPGASEVVAALSEYLGIEAGEIKEPLKAFVSCRGNSHKSRKKYEYRGMQDCNALKLLYSGDNACEYGCLGGGSCMKVCPVDAIDYDKEGCVVVDPEKCIGCQKCLDVCPSNVIKMIPESADYAVACNSVDKGGVVKKYCTVGCIGCKICEKVSPEGGFLVRDFLADIDYIKSGDRDKAAEKCPAKCILKLNN